MYRYDEFDETLVRERVRQFRGQVARRLSGAMTEDQFRPLRLMNGFYVQLHSYMLRVAIPYGTLSSQQMRQLGFIARRWDKGYGHFTTRQNIQYHWPRIEDAGDILEALADVEMHAIQTSGNCIRNITSDPYAGAGDDEIEDPRIWAEMMRQWSSFHPEFSFLPRKFKIAVNGSPHDRAAILMHDIGIQLVRGKGGETGFKIFVGGGQGRTPMIGKEISAFTSERDLFPYLEAIMRVYNRHGRRDNLFKSRIKILVHTLGIDEMRRQVEEAFQETSQIEALSVPPEEVERIRAYFAPPPYDTLEDEEVPQPQGAPQDYARWTKTNLAKHRVAGYAIVNVSLKKSGETAGDASAEQMEAMADIADRFSFGEIRVTHEQNLVLAHVRKRDLFDLWNQLAEHDLATANIGFISDQIVCPGLDYCNLANARSIPISKKIAKRFEDWEEQRDIGAMKVKISGCINACGHHHVGHVGILGVDKKGTEYFQITLGGSADEKAAVGEIVGPAFTEDEAVDAIEKIVETYKKLRADDAEPFIETWRRVGTAPFKERLYGSD